MESGSHTIVQSGGLFGRYAQSGHLLYVHEGKLYAAAFDQVDPSPDGSRAAVIRSEDPRRESLVVLVNFFDHLRRVAPAVP